MKTCTVVVRDEVNCKLEGLDLDIRRILTNKFKYEVPYARYLPAVKLGRWDGKVAYFQMGGSTYVNLLPEIIPVLEQHGYDIELDDQREPGLDLEFQPVHEQSFAHIVWPQKHVLAGQPIELRDYQVSVINNFLANPQSLQAIPTGAGKCLAGHTEIAVWVDTTTEFGSYLAFQEHQSGQIKLPIQTLANYLEEFHEHQLRDNQEIHIQDHGLTVSTPQGRAPVLYFIKKFNLPMVQLRFSNGYVIQVAQHHILRQDHQDVYVSELKVGDPVDHAQGQITVVDIQHLDNQDCYDLGLPAPHLYHDAHGLVHHNTIITAALSSAVTHLGRSIVIVPNKSLVTQTEADYINLELDVGVYFGDRKEYNRMHTICTWQSLHHMLKNTRNHEAEVTIQEFLEGVVCVIVDEVHGAKSDSLKALLTGVMAHIPIRWGLTGTIPKEKFEFQALLASLGPVINHMAASDLQDRGVLAQCHINIVQMVDHREHGNYQSELKYLLGEPGRLDAMAQLILTASQTGGTLVLVDRISAGQALVERLGDRAVFLSGENNNHERQEHYDQVGQIKDKIIVATFGIAAVGINIVAIHNVFLIEPGKSFVRVIQSIGRGLRKGGDKSSVEIYDITSTCKFSRRHLTKRKQYYNEAGYKFTTEKLQWS